MNATAVIIGAMLISPLMGPINTVFIALASIAVSQVLSFPNRTLIDAVQKSCINNMITVLILVTVIPGVHFGYGLVQKEAFMDRTAKLTHNLSIVAGTYLLKAEVNRQQMALREKHRQEDARKMKSWLLKRTGRQNIQMFYEI